MEKCGNIHCDVVNIAKEQCYAFRWPSVANEIIFCKIQDNSVCFILLKCHVLRRCAPLVYKAD